MKRTKRWSRGSGDGLVGDGDKLGKSWRGQSCGEFAVGEAVEVIGDGDLVMVVQAKGKVFGVWETGDCSVGMVQRMMKFES